MGQPVVHFEISGKDFKKSIDFYKNLFDWKVELWGDMPYGMVQPQSERSIGGGIGAAQQGQPNVTFYIQVDDLQAYLNKAEQLGGKMVVPPSPIPGVGSMAMFSDPDGNILGLFKAGE
jgi:predicted enzyme related to lactoylglutathione lyase